MGKKREARKGLENVFFTRTEPDSGAESEATQQPPQEEEDKKKDKSLSKGVALKSSEWDALSEIAEEYGISRNALIRYALTHFIAAHETGDARVEFESVRQLKLPGD